MKPSLVSNLSASTIHSSPNNKGVLPKNGEKEQFKKGYNKHYIINELKSLRQENDFLIQKILQNNRRIDTLEQYILRTDADACTDDSTSFNITFDQENVVYSNETDQDTLEDNYLALNQTTMSKRMIKNKAMSTGDETASDDNGEVSSDELITTDDKSPRKTYIKFSDKISSIQEVTPNVVQDTQREPKMSLEYQNHYEMMMIKRHILEEIVASCPNLFSPQRNRFAFPRKTASHGGQDSNTTVTHASLQNQKKVHFDIACHTPEKTLNDSSSSVDTHDCALLLNSHDISQESFLHERSMMSPHAESLPSSIQDDSESISEIKFHTHMHSKSDQSIIHVEQLEQNSTVFNQSPIIMRKIQELEQKVNLLFQHQLEQTPQKSQPFEVSSIFSDPTSSLKKIIELSTLDQSLLDRLYDKSAIFDRDDTEI